jgi:hypothetical protein
MTEAFLSLDLYIIFKYFGPIFLLKNRDGSLVWLFESIGINWAFDFVHRPVF